MDTEAPATGYLQSVAGERAGTVKQQLFKLFRESLRTTFPTEPNVEPLIAISQKFDDYQCNNALSIFSKIKGKSTEYGSPKFIAEALVGNLPVTDIIESTSVVNGFINILLSKKWIAQNIQKMLNEGIGIWAPILPVTRTVVDFSSPNIAKELHVGHLRSTIIGDTIARMLEYSNVEVLRRNHIGDWGTQFGMLIAYVFDKFPNWEETAEHGIADLQGFYRESKKRFDADLSFKERAQKAVVQLQSGDPRYRKAWSKMCEISRIEFNQLYERLGVKLEEKGESFYNPYIPGVLEELTNKGLIEESEGARVIFIKGQKVPFIVVKSDGGYNYGSTDLAALWYRINEEKAEWIVYVTDVGQAQHFEMLFSAAKMAGWLPNDNRSFPRTSHVGFGLVLGLDGRRFRTRCNDVVRLIDLLDEAKICYKKELVERLKSNGKEWPDEELEETAAAVGYGAVKYADLKNNRLTNYQFDLKAMLNDKGNTAVYLQYAHARICSIIKKSGKNIEELKKSVSITLDHKDERALGLYLVQFSEVVEEACTNLLPSVLCEYLYKLSETFTTFYTSCQVVGSEQETSRLLLCEATVIVMRKCFDLLGIEPVYRL